MRNDLDEALRYHLLERADPHGMDIIGTYSTFEEGQHDVINSLYTTLVYEGQAIPMNINNVYLYDTENEDYGFSISLLWLDKTKVTPKGAYQIKFSPRSKVREVGFATEFVTLDDCIKMVGRLITKLMAEKWQVDFALFKDETEICMISTFETENEPSEIARLHF